MEKWALPISLAFLSCVILTTIGAKWVILLLNKLPWEKIHRAFYSLGRTQSVFFATKMGKAFYEPLETFINEKIQLCLSNYFSGTDSDDEDK